MIASGALSNVQVSGSNLNITFVILAVALGALAIAVVIMVVYRDSDVERTSQRLAIAGLSFCAAALVTATIVVHQLRSGRWHTEMPALMWATVLFLAIGGSTLAGSTTGLKVAV